MVHALSLVGPTTPDLVLFRIQDLLQRTIAERCGIPLTREGEYPELARLTLTLDPSLGSESYAIRDDPLSGLIVSGGSSRGLLYGVGRLLREASYTPNTFSPGVWRGTSSPTMLLRGIYFATHFHNWYHDAPVYEIERYVEELALWGTNIVIVWFDQHHFTGLTDPDAQAMLKRLKAILNAAKRIGLQTAIGVVANEGYANSPNELRADWTSGHNGYHHEPQGHYHVEICPSKPGGTALILREYEEKLLEFGDIGLDYIWLWPYDQGACTCPACAPWGANGFLRMAEAEARIFKGLFPTGKVILSTWFFDHFTDGEWAGLDRAFAVKPDWCDYLLADDCADTFPPYPLQHGVPGSLPMVSFLEISMYQCTAWSGFGPNPQYTPWGGWGANPMPQHLQALWQPLKHALSGGFPYSEGIYEDLNKAVCAQYFWDPDQPTVTSVRQYLAYEFGAENAELLSRVIEIQEHTLLRNLSQQEGVWRTLLAHNEGVEEAWRIVREVAVTLSPERQTSWRWRIIYLRALLDSELVSSGGLNTPACEVALQELTCIYHAEQAQWWVAPPTAEALAARRE
ncbi:MAG: beta-N-acetylhexosaminidase family protein [Anaerolineae bacterium]